MKNRIKSVIVVVALVLVAGGTKAKNNETEIARSLDMFASVFKNLHAYYVDTINTQKSVDRAINAMLDDIDPYTEYYPAKEQEEFRSLTKGEYAGVGSAIVFRDGATYFSEPYEGSPAALAGILPGDKIVKVDGDSVIGLAIDKVSERLKGQPKTVVKIELERPHVGKVELELVRQKIQIPSVPYFGVQRENLGYISLTTFSEKSAQEVKDALLELKKNPAVKNIVLDLRGNGGGLLESAVQIVGYFVPKGTEVLTQKGKLKQNTKIYKTTQEPIDDKTPLVVLIDGGSASSSEIVAGALQDLDRAVVIGNRSYGKGLVQTTLALPYDAMMKVTTAKYYIPSGRLIQAIDYSHRNPDGSVARIPDSLTTVYRTANGREVRDGGGITPDIEVEYPKVNRLAYNIVKDFWAFDFATKYYHENKDIPAVEDFVITDSIYNQFKRFINPDKFQYDKVCEDGLKQLREVADTEGYMNDSTKAVFAQLEKLLKHDLHRDLDIHRKMIAHIVALEIVKRPYYQRGAAIQELKDDPAMDAAVKLFATDGEYEKTLKPTKTKETSSKK